MYLSAVLSENYHFSPVGPTYILMLCTYMTVCSDMCLIALCVIIVILVVLEQCCMYCVCDFNISANLFPPNFVNTVQISVGHATCT